MQTTPMSMTRSERPVFKGEPPDPWHEPSVRERALKTALYTVLSSARHFEPQRRSFDDFFHRWANKPAKVRNEGARRSNIPSGRASEICDTVIAEMLGAMVESKTLISAIPTEMADDDAANAAERLMQYRFNNLTEAAGGMGWWPVFDQMVNQCAIFGGSPAKAQWEIRTINAPIFPENGGPPKFVKKVGYQGPTTSPIFVFDYFPHPNKVWAGDDYPQAHVTWENYSDLKSLSSEDSIYEDVDRIPEIAGMTKYLASQFEGGEQIAEGMMVALGDLSKRADQRQQLGWTHDSRLLPDGIFTIECEAMFRPGIEYYDAAGNYHEGDDPVRCIITVANGHVVRVAPTPVLTGDSIWQFAKFNHIPGQMYGMSYIQKAKPMLHAEEVLLNMMVTGIAQNLNRPKVVRRDLLEGAQSLDDRPGGIVMAKHGADINQVMREIQTSPIGGEVMSIMSYVWGRSQGMTGITDVLMGRVPSGEQTATETNRAFQQISKRFQHAFVWFGASFVHPLARLFWRLDQALLPLPYRFMILGNSAGRSYKMVMTASEMAMQPDFMFMGPDRARIDSVRVAQIQDLWGKASAVQNYEWGQNFLKDLLVKINEVYDILDADRLKERIMYEAPASIGMDLAAQLAAQGNAGGAMGGGSGQRVVGQMPAGAGRADRRDMKGISSEQKMMKSLSGMLSNVKAA